MAETDGPTECLKEIIECSMCFESMKQPKCLPCGHGFCLTCLKNYKASNNWRAYIICAVCRHKTQIPKNGLEGLPTDYRVNKAKECLDKANKTGLTTVTPLLCDKPDHTNAVLDKWCGTCEELLCIRCSNQASHEDHVVSQVSTTGALEKYHKCKRNKKTSVTDLLLKNCNKVECFLKETKSKNCELGRDLVARATTIDNFNSCVKQCNNELQNTDQRLENFDNTIERVDTNLSGVKRNLETKATQIENLAIEEERNRGLHDATQQLEHTTIEMTTELSLVRRDVVDQFSKQIDKLASSEEQSRSVLQNTTQRLDILESTKKKITADLSIVERALTDRVPEIEIIKNNEQYRTDKIRNLETTTKELELASSRTKRDLDTQISELNESLSDRPIQRGKRALSFLRNKPSKRSRTVVVPC